jgi:ATP-binding cassette subfamily C protein CydD
MAVETRQSMRWLLDRSRPARGAICRAVVLSWSACLLVVAQSFLLSRIIHGVFIEGRPPRSLAASFAGLAAAVALRGVVGWLRQTSAFSAGAQVRQAVRGDLLDRIVARGPAVSGRESAGAAASVVMEQVEGLQDFYALFLPQLAVVVLVPLTIAAAVVPVSWAAGALLLATAPMIPLFTVLVGMGAENVSQRHFQALARLSARFLDVLQGMATLKLFYRSRGEQERIRQASADYRRRTMRVLRVAFLSSAVLEFFASLSIALVAVYLGMTLLGYFSFGTYGRALTLADGLFILLLAPEFYLPLRELGAHYHARAQALAAAEGIRAILAGSPAGGPGGALRLETAQSFHIRCRDLEFAYDDGRRPALRGVSLELVPGRRTVMLGGSGAGKSTLVSLVAGFLKPSGGDLLVNGRPLADLDPEFWRRLVGWLGQNPVLFHGSIRTNLLMGRPEAGEADLHAAAQAAGVLDFARRLPMGLDSPVGEQGLGLSRGQAQRVALGRVILKNAPVLLLDEPTAGLDAGTEERVLEAIRAFAGGRTVLTVTHRLADVRGADAICVLEEGRIVEQGGYQELMAAGGRLRQLAAPVGGGRHHG